MEREYGNINPTDKVYAVADERWKLWKLCKQQKNQTLQSPAVSIEVY